MPSKRKSSACVDYVPALCTHRPSLLPIEWLSEAFGLPQGRPATASPRRKVRQTWSFRGSKSRNKVSVGEPAEGSLMRACGLTSPRTLILCLLSQCGFYLGTRGLAFYVMCPKGCHSLLTPPKKKTKQIKKNSINKLMCLKQIT